MKNKNMYFTKSIIFLSLFLIVFAGFAQSLTDGLKLHYTFKSANGTTVNDQVGSNHGMLINGATVASDGTHFYLDLPSVEGTARPYFDMGPGTGLIISELSNFTISFHMKVPTGYKSDFTWNFSNSENIGTDANGHMFFDCVHQKTAITPTHHDAEAGNKIEIGSSIPTDVWFHYTFTLDALVGKYYINGVELATAPFAIQPKDLGATEYNWIGRCSYDGGGALAGQYNVNPAQIADFRIYNRALTAAEITELSSMKTSDNELALNPTKVSVQANPHSRKVTFTYTLESTNHTSFEVFSIDGKKLSSLADQVLKAGLYQHNWNAPAKGIYIYKLKTGKVSTTGKITIQ